MDLSLVIASNIQYLMEHAHITQNELAVQLGLSRQTVSKLLKGKAPFDIVQLEKVARIFRLSVEDLLNEKSLTKAKICYRFTTPESDVPEGMEELLTRYIERYRTLSAKVGDTSIFIPEQYSLFAKVKGKKINVSEWIRWIIILGCAAFVITTIVQSRVQRAKVNKKPIVTIGYITNKHTVTGRGNPKIWIDY